MRRDEPVEQPEPADTIDAIVRAVPGVADLHSGMFGEIATHLPGRRVVGIRIGEGVIDVHITAWAGTPVRETAAAVRSAVATEFPGVAVDVTVEAVAMAPSTGAD
ncbi:Asp23/Gls24 family envelope stress response protein [Mycolicibacterium sp. BiH015]|uniref:Asp23/Gls24 family envelope stress response protein n=1 Tax=Mycolicibacterium sp. BiH015 TaxID=3018808 RepID=UPI0022E60523|nr:Asp23/Gls24 family envelope stress response protein [Mycolicibacterium sp. BiH015]MDA2892529.1 Asp23/Gls24 family envelope stress response protein [Mycolicibacterium sp. BiH015]